MDAGQDWVAERFVLVRFSETCSFAGLARRTLEAWLSNFLHCTKIFLWLFTWASLRDDVFDSPVEDTPMLPDVLCS